MKTTIQRFILRFFGARGFGKFFIKISRSKTYSEFCKQVYGEDLCQLNMTDMDQLKMLLQVVAIRQGERVLDLGCGAGQITEYVAKNVHAQILGVDFAPKAIELAQKRTKALGERLSFQVANMNHLEFAEKSFDVIFCIDTLYFVTDLSEVIGKLKAMLKPGGRIGAFYSTALKKDQDLKVLLPENTELGVALGKNGLSYKTWDFTDNDRQIWLKSIAVANSLKEDFAREKNLEIYKSRIAESEKCLKPHQEKRVSRYLYLISV